MWRLSHIVRAPASAGILRTVRVTTSPIAATTCRYSMAFFSTPSSSPSTFQQEAEEEIEEIKSMNRTFRDIQVYPKILAQIRSLGLGKRPNPVQAKRLDKITASVMPINKNIQDIDTRNSPDGKPKPSSLLTTIQPEDRAARNERFKPPRPFGSYSFPVRIVGELTSPNQALPLFLDNVPQAKIPQVAICGRSNVGKSTLLNTLLYSNLQEDHRKPNLHRREVKTFALPKGVKAETSAKPGETKTITFYQLGSPHPEERSKDLRLVVADLPGYGFAFANPYQRLAYQSMMRNYLTSKLPNQLESGNLLKRVLLLIDARHGMKAADMEFLEMIQATIAQDNRALKQDREKQEAKQRRQQREQQEEEDGSFSAPNQKVQQQQQQHDRFHQLPPIQIVLTKCDLVQQMDLARRVVQVREQLSDALVREPSAPLPVMMVSARTNKGVLELQRQIASLAVKIDPKPPPRWEAAAKKGGQRRDDLFGNKKKTTKRKRVSLKMPSPKQQQQQQQQQQDWRNSRSSKEQDTVEEDKHYWGGTSNRDYNNNNKRRGDNGRPRSSRQQPSEEGRLSGREQATLELERAKKQKRKLARRKATVHSKRPRARFGKV